MVESLLSGTPVVAHARGSLPQLLSPEAGALLGDDDGVWARTLRGEDELVFGWTRERCREWAASKFHYLGMAKSYLQLYEQVQRGACSMRRFLALSRIGERAHDRTVFAARDGGSLDRSKPILKMARSRSRGLRGMVKGVIPAKDWTVLERALKALKEKGGRLIPLVWSFMRRRPSTT